MITRPECIVRDHQIVEAIVIQVCSRDYNAIANQWRKTVAEKAEVNVDKCSIVLAFVDFDIVERLNRKRKRPCNDLNPTIAVKISKGGAADKCAFTRGFVLFKDKIKSCGHFY